MNIYDKLMVKVVAEFPRFRVRKASETWLGWVMKLLGWVTRAQYGEFTTTIGSTMYVTNDWDFQNPLQRYATLRHELMHVRQFHSWPLGRGRDGAGAAGWWPGRLRTGLNHVLMAIGYTVLMPAFWTLRARFEREGYTQTLLVARELSSGDLDEKSMVARAEWLADVFGGGSYFWMWNRRAAYKWAMETQKKINAGLCWNVRDRVDLGH